jgi:hypothetical protein
MLSYTAWIQTYKRLAMALPNPKLLGGRLGLLYDEITSWFVSVLGEPFERMIRLC